MVSKSKKVGKKSTLKAAIDTDRTSTGVLSSLASSRDIKIENFSLSFHGRLLISNTSIELNYGRRYGLIGANGSGKTTLLECLAHREVPIPEHIDIYLLNEEAPPTDLNALEFVVSEAEKEIHVFILIIFKFYFIYKIKKKYQVVRKVKVYYIKI